MSLSSEIAALILQMLREADSAEIQRNELAQVLGCVPSQINYVLASRFTPEQGYLVESRRGGGGYIKITRVRYERGAMLMHVINSVGSTLDARSCRAHILNLHHRELLDGRTVALLLAACSENVLQHLEQEQKEETRAALFKQLLLTAMQAEF